MTSVVDLEFHKNINIWSNITLFVIKVHKSHLENLGSGVNMHMYIFFFKIIFEFSNAGAFEFPNNLVSKLI